MSKTSNKQTPPNAVSYFPSAGSVSGRLAELEAGNACSPVGNKGDSGAMQTNSGDKTSMAYTIFL